MENSLLPWPQNFPLAGAVYIEFLAKRGHFINANDRAEALQRNDQSRIGSRASTHTYRIDWLDKAFPREDMSRYAMDRISMLGVLATPALARQFLGSYPPDKVSTAAAKDIINTYNESWLIYQSPAVPGRSALATHDECVARHMAKFGTYGHNTRSTGCSGGEVDTEGWELVEVNEEREWTVVNGVKCGDV